MVNQLRCANWASSRGMERWVWVSLRAYSLFLFQLCVVPHCCWSVNLSELQQKVTKIKMKKKKILLFYYNSPNICPSVSLRLIYLAQFWKNFLKFLIIPEKFLITFNQFFFFLSKRKLFLYANKVLSSCNCSMISKDDIFKTLRK